MTFISLPMAKLHKKTKAKKLKNFPVWSVGKFYRNLAQDIDGSVNQDFYGKIAKDVEIQSQDLQKYLLATIDFAKGMQDAQICMLNATGSTMWTMWVLDKN